MKRYVFEIHVKAHPEMDGDFFKVLLDCFLGILAAFAVEVVVAGVAEETEKFSLGESDPEHEA